jgi:PAS domain-containing protein
MDPTRNSLSDHPQYYTLNHAFEYPHASLNTAPPSQTNLKFDHIMSDTSQTHSPTSEIRSYKAGENDERAGSVISSANVKPSAAQQKPVGFEFTKRKRWAELLINELSECIIFILSPSGKIWFCGNAITELLGWRDDEVVDRDLISFMNGTVILDFLGAC